MSTPFNNSKNNAESGQARDANKHDKNEASQAQLSNIAGIGASLARFALNKPVTIGMLFLSMLLFNVVRRAFIIARSSSFLCFDSGAVALLFI